MVLRVCRQILPIAQDAEDAAQATFLVLARRAGTIGRRESVSCWLHGVALRVAAKARTAATRRRTHEQRGGKMRIAAHVVEGDLQAVEDHDDWAALHQELDQLPKSFRDPLILCYLDGLTQEQAAAQLRCPLGTIQSRLARGRAKLKVCFEKRGVSLSGMFVGAGQSALESYPPSQAWAEATVRLAMQFVQGKGPAIAGAGTASLVLAEQVLRTIVVAKTKVAAAVLMCGAFVVAAAWAIHDRKSDAPPANATTLQPETEQPAGKLTLKAIDAPTGEPIEAVSIDYICDFGEKRQQATIFTGEDGTVAIEWPADAIVRRLWFTARAPDRVPIDILWEHGAGRWHCRRRSNCVSSRAQPSVAFCATKPAIRSQAPHSKSARPESIMEGKVISSAWVPPQRTLKAAGVSTSHPGTWRKCGSGRRIRTFARATSSHRGTSTA